MHFSVNSQKYLHKQINGTMTARALYRSAWIADLSTLSGALVHIKIQEEFAF
jgi:hypothetical protein